MKTRLTRMISLAGTSLGIIMSSNGVFRVAFLGWNWFQVETRQQLISSKETLPLCLASKDIFRHLVGMMSIFMFSLIVLCYLLTKDFEGIEHLNSSFPPVSFLWLFSSKFIVIRSSNYSYSSFLLEALLLEAEGCC